MRRIEPRLMFSTMSQNCGDMLRSILSQYHELGIGVAIDDVGVGYSGLERIVALRPDYLKIDISLVRDIHVQRFKQSAVAALIKIATDMGSVPIAEGVEKTEEFEHLRDAGVALGQGFLFGYPVAEPSTATPEAVA